MSTTTPLPVILPEAQFEGFDVLNFGALSVPAKPSRFGFQLDVTPTPGLTQVVFGLVQPSTTPRGKARVGFAVRIDLERGEIWDLINDSGLIGWVETPLGCDNEAPSFLLSLEIERIGSALLPKLQVGGEEWLYPAVRSLESLDFIAVSGCGGASHPQPEAFAHLTKPSVWCEGS